MARVIFYSRIPIRERRIAPMIISRPLELPAAGSWGTGVAVGALAIAVVG